MNGLEGMGDTLGHLAGDEYILWGCILLCGRIKRSSVFRVGGDKLVVLLRGSTTTTAARPRMPPR